jgi:hypothetical protein
LRDCVKAERMPDGVEEDGGDPAGEMSATGLADMLVEGEWSAGRAGGGTRVQRESGENERNEVSTDVLLVLAGLQERYHTTDTIQPTLMPLTRYDTLLRASGRWTGNAAWKTTPNFGRRVKHYLVH